ncbi:MAG: hypothetical protein ACJAXS_002070 [Colwellia sp.]|jgi:hypothetical protein
MKNNKLSLLIYTISLLSFTVYSEEKTRTDVKKNDKGDQVIEIIDADNGSPEIKQSDINGVAAYNSIMKVATTANLPTELVKQTAEFIKLLLDKRKIDTDLLYNYVLTLNANISQLPEDKFVKDIRIITAKLRASSYSDKIHYNTNLSNQLRTRMPLLVKASLLLNDTSVKNTVIKYRKEDFKEELEYFSDKYLKSSRFQAGLGFSYVYTPKITYITNANVDLSPFSPQTGGEQTSVEFDQSFANKSYLNFEIAAKLPWLELGLSIPTYSETSTITSPVLEVPLLGSDDQSAIYRSSIESNLEVEYGFSLRIPILGNYKRIMYKNPRNSQMDWGFLFGMTGLNIEDRVVTDVRFRNDLTPFNDLEAAETLETKTSTSFQTFYYGAYYEFEFVDEFYMTLDVRWHNNQKNNGSQIDVDGFTTSLRLIYSPTLDFIDW